MIGSGDTIEEIEAPHDLPHRLSWRVGGVRPGAHRSKLPGSGGVFRDVVPFTEAPDPRRIDIRSSVRDPTGRLYVKRFEQQSAATIYALVDLSASMGFVGAADRMRITAQLIAALAASSRRIGDAFGLLGCADVILDPFDIHATSSRAGERQLLSDLMHYRPVPHAGAAGLLSAAGRLAGRRKLVFLISDFQFSSSFLDEVFAALGQHDVVPIMLRDGHEIEDLPDWRLLPFYDLETGRGRLFLMRPSLKKAWRTAEEERFKRLSDHAIAAFGSAPYVVSSGIDWADLGDYLMTGRA